MKKTLENENNSIYWEELQCGSLGKNIKHKTSLLEKYQHSFATITPPNHLYTKKQVNYIDIGHTLNTDLDTVYQFFTLKPRCFSTNLSKSKAIMMYNISPGLLLKPVQVQLNCWLPVYLLTNLHEFSSCDDVEMFNLAEKYSVILPVQFEVIKETGNPHRF